MVKFIRFVRKSSPSGSQLPSLSSSAILAKMYLEIHLLIGQAHLKPSAMKFEVVYLDWLVAGAICEALL
eukprot:1868772-Prymnesium_polylepis.1